MFTLSLLHISPTRTLLICFFPFRLLPAFKAAVPDTDRIWHAPLKSWELTICGFHALCHAEAERLAPLPENVLDFAFPHNTAAHNVSGLSGAVEQSAYQGTGA